MSLVLFASGGAAQSSVSREMLSAHNDLRARLHLPPLKWSPALAAYAKEWADHLAFYHEFRHRARPRHGENLFMLEGSNAKATTAEVVRNWAFESLGYDYRRNECHGICGHYTQIVWRDTRRLGCAVSRAFDREVWVCNYDPPGNIIGQRPY